MISAVRTVSSVPGWSPNLSIEAERAIRSLNRLRIVIARSQATIRLIPRPTRRAQLSDLAELGVVRAFSVLESYLSERADTIIREDLPVPASPTSLTHFAHLNLLGAFRGNFERGMVGFWKKALDVDLQKLPDGWSNVDEFRELRNLLTHGLGYVRPGGAQLPSSLTKRLRKVTADPGTFTGRVPVENQDFDEIARLVRSTVLWVDQQVT